MGPAGNEENSDDGSVGMGASVLAVGYVIPMVYFIWSLRYGKVAGANPWKATGLEWRTASPPPPHNFEETPVVRHGAYDYSTTMGEVIEVG